jgi:hypothetical protein
MAAKKKKHAKVVEEDVAEGAEAQAEDPIITRTKERVRVVLEAGENQHKYPHMLVNQVHAAIDAGMADEPEEGSAEAGTRADEAEAEADADADDKGDDPTA